MGWVKYTAPLAEGTRPTAPQMAELVAAFHERAQCGLVNANGAGAWGVTADQATLAATNLETACIYWTGTASSSASAAQMLDAAITAIAAYYVCPAGGTWAGTVLTQAATDLGVNWTTAQSLMQAGLLNADYFNVCRHALQLLLVVAVNGSGITGYQKTGIGDSTISGAWAAFKATLQGAAEGAPGSGGFGIADDNVASVVIARGFPTVTPTMSNPTGDGWAGSMQRCVATIPVPNLPCFTAGYGVTFGVNVDFINITTEVLSAVNFNVGTGGSEATATITPADGANTITVPGATAVGATVPVEIRPVAYDGTGSGPAALDTYEEATDGQDDGMLLSFSAYPGFSLAPTFSFT